MGVTRRTMECVNEVVPLFFLRELDVAVSMRSPLPSVEEVREAVLSLVGNPDKCVVTVGQTRRWVREEGCGVASHHP